MEGFSIKTLPKERESEFTYLIASDCDAEYDYVEIYYNQELWAQINQEKDALEWVPYPKNNKKLWKLPLEEALNAFKDAKKCFLTCGKEYLAPWPLFYDLKEDPLNIDTSSWMLKSCLLDFSMALSYVTSSLNGKKNLSQSILEGVDFSKGHFFTLLPTITDESKIYSFQESVLPLDDERQPKDKSFGYIYNDWFAWIKAPAIRLIRKWMIERKGSFICEDTLYTPPTFVFEINHPVSVFFNKEPYHHVDPKKHEWWLLRDAFQWSETTSYFCGVIFNEEEGLFKENRVQEGAFERIAKNASLVLVGAYNGDGYIFWQKDPFDLHSIGIPVANVKEI